MSLGASCRSTAKVGFLSELLGEAESSPGRLQVVMPTHSEDSSVSSDGLVDLQGVVMEVQQRERAVEESAQAVYVNGMEAIARPPRRHEPQEHMLVAGSAMRGAPPLGLGSLPMLM